MIRCLIADDEVIAHQILEQYILQVPGLVLVAKARNAMEAFAKLEQHSIDLIFLDIEMPLVNGISFLKTLSNPPKVIFTTAYSEYALEGYELNVVDYLLKPFSFDRFCKAVEKARAAIQGMGLPAQEQVEGGHLVIKEREGMLRIPYEEILYIEASGDYMKIVTAGRQHLVHLTMKKLEESLPVNSFARTHKSYIVGMKHIKLLKPDSLLMVNNVSIPVSVNYKEEVTARFKK